jgi:hypothetical protein
LIETNSQYLRLLEETLRTASHIGAVGDRSCRDGFISTQELVETVVASAAWTRFTRRIFGIDRHESRDYYSLI